jgi:hypothetical protein
LEILVLDEHYFTCATMKHLDNEVRDDKSYFFLSTSSRSSISGLSTKSLTSTLNVIIYNSAIEISKFSHVSVILL